MHSLPTRQLQAGEAVLLNPTLKDISLTPDEIILLDRMGVPPERRDEFVQDVAQILYAVFDTLFQ